MFESSSLSTINPTNSALLRSSYESMISYLHNYLDMEKASLRWVRSSTEPQFFDNFDRVRKRRRQHIRTKNHSRKLNKSEESQNGSVEQQGSFFGISAGSFTWTNFKRLKWPRSPCKGNPIFIFHSKLHKLTNVLHLHPAYLHTSSLVTVFRFQIFVWRRAYRYCKPNDDIIKKIYAYFWGLKKPHYIEGKEKRKPML